MRRPASAAALCLAIGAVLVSPGLAMASHDPSGAPFDEDFVVGSFLTPLALFTIDGHSGPSGENPTGVVTVSDRGVAVTGDVTCLAVTGSRATVGVDFPQGIGGGFFFLEDNDGARQDAFGGLASPTGEPPSVCSASPSSPLTPISTGDITVHDAPPLPTSKDQCKNEGLRNFPQFQNKVQCVLFVVRSCGQRGRFEPKPKNCPVRLPNR